MRLRAAVLLIALLGSSAVADDEKPDVILEDLIKRLAIEKPTRVTFKYANAKSALESERQASPRGGIAIGISPGRQEFADAIRITGPQRKRIKSNTSGSYFRDKDGRVTFGKKIIFEQSGYYMLAFSKTLRWLTKVRFVDATGRMSSLEIPARESAQYVFSDPLKGPGNRPNSR
jgi:hypothetical protein